MYLRIILANSEVDGGGIARWYRTVVSHGGIARWYRTVVSRHRHIRSTAKDIIAVLCKWNRLMT
jgi:hypothetical protein